MKDKLKEIFDMRSTWAVIGAFIGSAFGEPWTTVANSIGVAVMAVL